MADRSVESFKKGLNTCRLRDPRRDVLRAAFGGWKGITSTMNLNKKSIADLDAKRLELTYTIMHYYTKI